MANSSELHSAESRIAAFSVLSIVCLTGTVGHGMMIHVIRTSTSFHKQCGAFLLNFSVIGIFLNVLCIPLYMTNILAGTNVYGETGCSLVGFLNCALFLASLANAVVIAIQRCIMMTKPCNFFTKKRTKITLLLLWVIPVCGALAGFPFYGFSSHQLHCIFKDEILHTWITVVMFSVPTIVVLLIICLCYIIICCTVSKSKRSLLLSRSTNRVCIVTHIKVDPVDTCSCSSLPPVEPFCTKCLKKLSSSLPDLSKMKRKQDEVKRRVARVPGSLNLKNKLVSWSDAYRRELKLTFHLLINFTFFCVLWTPLVSLYIVACFTEVAPGVWLTCSVLARFYSATNWIIYGIWSKSARHSLMTILGIHTNTVGVMGSQRHLRMSDMRKRNN